jgi:hypothetical protein
MRCPTGGVDEETRTTSAAAARRGFILEAAR